MRITSASHPAFLDIAKQSSMIGERKPSWRNSRIHASWTNVRNGVQRYFTPIPGRIRDFQRSSPSPRISEGKSEARTIAELCIHLASAPVQVTITQVRDSSHRVHRCPSKIEGVDVAQLRVSLSPLLKLMTPRESAETAADQSVSSGVSCSHCSAGGPLAFTLPIPLWKMSALCICYSDAHRSISSACCTHISSYFMP